MNIGVRPPRYVCYRPHSLRRTAGILEGQIGSLSRPADVRGNGYRAHVIEPAKEDSLLAALGGDVDLRGAVHEATIAFSNQTVCNWTEKLDVHLPVAKGLEGESKWEYLDITADSLGRIWIEEAGSPRDRTEYWLSLATLALSGVSLANTSMDESDAPMVSGSDVASWFYPSARRGRKFSDAMKSVSLRLQESLRKIAGWWLMEERNLDDVDTSNAMLVFMALPVRAGRYGTKVVPDALVQNYSRLPKTLLTSLRQRMEDLYLDLPAERFHPSHAADVYASVERHPHHLKRLIGEQASIMETFIQLSDDARACRDLIETDKPMALKAAAKIPPKVSRELQVKLRRFAPEVHTERAACTVLVSASSGMTEYAEVDRGASDRYQLLEKNPAA